MCNSERNSSLWSGLALALVDNVAYSLNHDIRPFDLDVMAAPFGYDPITIGRKTRQFFLHCFVVFVEIPFNVSREPGHPQRLGIAGDYN